MPTVHFEVVRHEEQARRPPRIAIMCGIAAFGFKSGVLEAAQQWLTRDSAHDDYRADFGAPIHRGPLT